jgi:hypothetical protein
MVSIDLNCTLGFDLNIAAMEMPMKEKVLVREEKNKFLDMHLT